MKIMEQDQTYKYFQESLSRWIKKQKEQGEAPQKIISIRAEVTEGTVSKYLSPKRKKPIPFEMQVAFARACGYEYFDFLKKGKESLESGVPLKDTSSFPITALQQRQNERYVEMIDRFRNHNLAVEIIDLLVEYEKLEEVQGLMEIKKYIAYQINESKQKQTTTTISSQKNGTVN